MARTCKAEIEHAKSKLDQTKRWSRTFGKNVNDYRGTISPLSSALDGSAQKAVILIERSIASLEQYLSTSTPTSEITSNSTAQPTSISRKGEDNTESQHDEHANSDRTVNESNKSPDIPMDADD